MSVKILGMIGPRECGAFSIRVYPYKTGALHFFLRFGCRYFVAPDQYSPLFAIHAL